MINFRDRFKTEYFTTGGKTGDVVGRNNRGEGVRIEFRSKVKSEILNRFESLEESVEEKNDQTGEQYSRIGRTNEKYKRIIKEEENF